MIKKTYVFAILYLSPSYYFSDQHICASKTSVLRETLSWISDVTFGLAGRSIVIFSGGRSIVIFSGQSTIALLRFLLLVGGLLVPLSKTALTFRLSGRGGGTDEVTSRRLENAALPTIKGLAFCTQRKIKIHKKFKRNFDFVYGIIVQNFKKMYLSEIQELWTFF